MSGRTRCTLAALTAALLLPLAATAAVAGEQPEPVHINVQANQVLKPVSRYLTGACIEDVNHEIYGGIYSQMIFGESFQEPAPPPAIQGFQPYEGRWMVRDGVLTVNGLDGPKLVHEGGAFEDGAVGVEVLFADRQGGNAGLIVRVSQPGKGADSFSGYEVSLDAARQTLRLGRHRHNFEPIKDVRCEVAVGRWIPLEVNLAGSAIEILVDGKSVLRHDDGLHALPAGGVGLRAWHRQASYRKLWVKTGGQIVTCALAQTVASPEISGMWRAVRRGQATGQYALVTEKPWAGVQSQQMSLASGTGEWGIENQGLNRWGMNFAAGKAYEGYLRARAEKPTTLFVALESQDGSRIYAETPLAVTGNGWQRLQFSLTPTAADKSGRFALKLKQPGSVTLGYAFLQPGAWGRFQGLPVRRDVAEGLIAQGVTVLRYGGSMVNHGGYRWKKMTGARDRRPPYSGTWYRYSSNGWGIADFMAFCEAAGFEYVPAFNVNETPQDMADFMQYAKGPADSPWGRQRVADGHPRPYRLKYMELGNEERVDGQYAAKFAALAKVLWANDAEIVLVVGDFAYSRRIEDPLKISGAASRITSLAGQQRILQLAKQYNREVWFDVHVGTDHPVTLNSSVEGMFSFCDALERIADGAKHKVVVFEYNAGNHAVKRALANAIATHAIERDGRLPIVTSANGLQPDGQNDNGWDQGLLFLDPAQVWLQPPGYVTQMFARNYLPQLVRCQVTGTAGSLDAVATRDVGGQTLVLQAVNPGDQPVAAQLDLAGFVPAQPRAKVTELSGPMDAVNTAIDTGKIVAKERVWNHALKGGKTSYTFPPHSFTVLRFE